MHPPQPPSQPWKPNLQGHRATMSLSSISPGSTPSSTQHRQRGAWYPDVYTAPFVPEYLRTVNTLPAHICRAISPPSVDFRVYVQSFCGSQFLNALPQLPDVLQRPGLLLAQQETKTSRKSGENVVEGRNFKDMAANLEPNTYSEHFSKLLEDEIKALDEYVKSFNLFNVAISTQDPHSWQFRIMIPGIRENTPPIQLGDMIKLRQVRPAKFPFPGGFTGYEYETFVFGMDRTEGYIVVRADGLWIEMGGTFNVIFGVQERYWEGVRRAVVDIDIHLTTETRNGAFVGEKEIPDRKHLVTQTKGSNSFLRRMLFPRDRDGKMQTRLNRGSFNRKWFDKELNYEQQKAIDSILQQDYGNIAFLVFGPAGTGKTKTLVEAALQLVYAPTTQKNHILLCAPSQEAADTLALRLIPHFNPNALLRLQQTSRTFKEVPSSLLAYSYIENDMFSIPAWEKLMRFRIVVCSCRDADMLVQARCTNRDLGQWEKTVVDSLRGVSEGQAEFVERGESVRLHWSVLLLDEAAQGLEPEVAIPLSVVAPPEDASNDKPIVVMAGDQRQLGPRTISKGALEISVFERLISRPVYSQHPLNRDIYSDSGPDKFQGKAEILRLGKANKNHLPYPRPPFANLVRNYRSHPAILAVPSAIFYNDTLIPEGRDTDRLENWTGWNGNRGIPVKFILNSGLDESHEEGLSFYNLRELDLAVDTVRSLLSASSWTKENGYDEVPITQEQIAVMSPYREQVRRLRRELRTEGFRKVNVGPVEAYQGSEYRFVIICTTRARERFLQGDSEKGAGLINEPRRLNVAMTRAKEGIVVIGNPWILERDSFWKEWMGFTWRHAAIEKDPIEVPSCSVPEPQGQENNPSNSGSSPLNLDTNPRSSEISATAGRTRPVNEWKPVAGEVETSNCISRLETALVYRSKAREGAVFGLNAGWDEDDPMFSSGIAAEALVRETEGLGLGIGLP
ncbi:P-loop containing nucleoside triphosphate hydrolase protein [Geopyxis carbonaria]|nr:P-loop containing nucleoside triphosphate hydrolase protein [Geopyxis carbonaria]